MGMNMDFDPFQRKIVNGPEAGANVKVDGFTVSVIGGGTGTETLYNAGTGIGIEGSTITNTMAGAGRIAVDGGTASFIPSADIVNVTGTSVTLQPDTAYKIYATSQAITLNANPPASGKWAYDGHLEIFVAGTGYVVTGSNVVLANALEPDAVNNCTVRFHDGIAIIAVEDHVAGYIVVNGSTSGEGSLAYGITTSTNDYVAFDASLNGTTIPLAGAVAEGEKHIVGNGYTETTLTGAVDCGTSKFTVANLSLDDVQVTGGVMTLGDAYIPSGSTVAVSGGGLAVEKVTGAGEGSVIDLGGTNVVIPSGSNAYASGCNFTSGYTSGSEAIKQNGGGFRVSAGGSLVISGGTFSNCRATRGAAFVVYGTADIYNVSFIGNYASNFGGAYMVVGGNATVSGCTFSGNTCLNNTGNTVEIQGGTTTIKDCQFEAGENIRVSAGSAILAGTNKLQKVYGENGSAIISSGATLDLTGNTNAAPIAPGGGIVFESGGATVKVGDSTASSSYMMDNVTLPAGAKLTNTAVVDFGESRIIFSGGSVSAYASGCTFSGTSSGYDASLIGVYSSTTARFVSCSFINTVTNGAVITINGSSTLVVSGCSVPLVRAYNSATLVCSDSELEKVDLLSNAGVQIVGVTNTIGVITHTTGFSGAVTISSGASINLTSSIAPGGTGGITVLTGGCTVNGNAIPAGTYTSIDSNGQPTE